MVRLHFWLTLGWATLVVPTVLWWSHSILWVLLMSIWANVSTHWGAYQAARAERVVRTDGGETLVCEGVTGDSTP